MGRPLMSTAPLSILARPKERTTRCPACGDKSGAPSCVTCMFHRNHSGGFDPACALCHAAQWKARINAARILLKQLLHLGAAR